MTRTGRLRKTSLVEAAGHHAADEGRPRCDRKPANHREDCGGLCTANLAAVDRGGWISWNLRNSFPCPLAFVRERCATFHRT